jgi:glucose/arabinose dehydrogenase
MMTKFSLSSLRAKRAVALLFAVASTLGLASCGTLQDWQDEKKGIQINALIAPAGYTVQTLATDLPKARHMVMGEQGTLFVGSMAGKVYALRIVKGVVTQQHTVLRGLTDPSGVAFRNGALYVADRTRIVRFQNIETRLDNPGPPEVVIDGLPDKARHDAHAMAFGPDGKLYVSVGSPCDVCEAKNDEYGVIVRVNSDGSGKEVVARGIRNSVGFDWHPQTKALWFTENGQDALGLQKPNDELNHVTKVGEHFGFPYCHDKDISDAEFGRKRACGEFTPPAFGLEPHVAALGMRFSTSPQLEGSASILIARHGSHPPHRVGYDVVRVILQAGSPPRMETYLTGFLQGQKYWGRPVDVLMMNDGAVLVSDDMNGAIYRVSRTQR